MTKYCIIYNDTILHGYKSNHKKSGSFAYGKYIELPGTFSTEPMLFNTPLQAKLWLITRSSFPRVAEYMFQFDEQKVDTLIAKGKYVLSKAFLSVSIMNSSGSKGSRYFHDRKKLPLLCEFIVMEYPE